jgi:hypothetical protein
VSQVRKDPLQSQILLRGEVGCFSQLGQRRRAESGHRNLAGSGTAHFVQFGPVDTGDSSPPTPRTAVEGKDVRAEFGHFSFSAPDLV